MCLKKTRLCSYVLNESWSNLLSCTYASLYYVTRLSVLSQRHSTQMKLEHFIEGYYNPDWSCFILDPFTFTLNLTVTPNDLIFYRIVELLVRARPECVHWKDTKYRRTPLHYTCLYSGSSDIVGFLLQYGADTDTQ